MREKKGHHGVHAHYPDLHQFDSPAESASAWCRQQKERVRAAPGRIVRLVTSCPCSEALLDNEDGILLSHSIRVHMRLVMSQKSAEVFVDELKVVAFLNIGSVQIECWLQEVFVTSACSIIAM